MATDPFATEAPLDIREQIARIDRLIVAATQTRQDLWFQPRTFVFTGMGAAAASCAAAIAFAKLFIG